MAGLRHFANLASDNALRVGRDRGAREALLCGSGAVGARVRSTCAALRAQGVPLAVDNGNTLHLARLTRRYAAAAAALARQRAAVADGPLPPELLAAHGALIDRIARAAQPLASAARQQLVLQQQDLLQPEFVTCLEDLTLPVLIGLDVEPAGLAEHHRTRLVRLQARGLRAAKLALRARAVVPGALPYATVHAFDYDSAFRVGAAAAGVAGLQALATGLASFLNDRNFVSNYVIGGERITTLGGRALPNRMLRPVLVTLGLLDGWRSVRRSALPRLHGLGAGAPMLLPLLALCTQGDTALSVDSTSPEKNASMGKLFTSRPAPLTLSIEGIAQALVDNRQVWDCPCPACRALLQVLPLDLERARAWYALRIAPRRLDLRDLEAEGGIGGWLGLCAQDPKHPQARAIRAARAEHSHWALAEVLQDLREHAASPAALRAHVGALCDAYQATTTAVYAAQVDECLRIIDRLRPLQAG